MSKHGNGHRGQIVSLRVNTMLAEEWMKPGSAKPNDTGEPVRTAIVEAIEDMRRSGVALHRLAKDAGVAPANVILIRDGKFHVETEDSEKKIAGKASTLTRLVLHANEWLAACDPPRKELELAKVLADYGIDTTAPDVGRTVSNVQGQAGQHRHASDPVLRQIALRQNVVNIGILKWSPFFIDTDSSASTSWAGDYTRRLVGSINPTDWKIGDFQTIYDIDAAVSALGSGSSSLDGIFGVYDTADKRLKGLRFVTLPGIAMPLAFVSVGDSVTWEKVILPDEQFKKDMQGIVLAGEIGDLFLSGPCQYSDQNLERQTSLDLKQMVKMFFGLISRRPGAPIFFCGDRSMCSDFIDVARRFATTDEAVLKALKELRISEADPVAPKYRLGMAVRADAHVWHELLQYSQDNEMFQNAALLTADRYADLLTRAVGNSGKADALSADIELICLTPEVPEKLALEFADRCWGRLKSSIREAYKDKFKLWRMDELPEERGHPK